MAQDIEPFQDDDEYLAIQSARWSGPLPPPSILKGYEEVVTGSARSLFENFATESKHRRDLEVRAADHTIWLSRMGMIAGYMTVLLLFVLAIVVLVLGHPWPAVSVMGIGLVTAISLFVKSSKSIGD